MSGRRWRVEITQLARQDLKFIVDATVEQYGRRQAERYRALLKAALNDLREGPGHPLARRRDDLPGDFFVMPVRRRGAAARHYLVCRVRGNLSLDVIRVLHDAMNLPVHLGVHEDAVPFQPGP